MRPGKLDEALRAAHRLDNAKAPDHRDDLERELLAKYRTLYRRRRLMFLNPHTQVGRFALGGAAVLALAIGACELPTSHEMEVGKQIHVQFTGTGENAKGTLQRASEVRQRLEGIPNADDMMCKVVEVNGEVRVDVLVWGRSLSENDIHAALGDDLEGVEVTVESLSGTVREKLRERLGRSLFNFDIDGETEEEIRAQILAQLAEQGFDGDAQVDVQVDGGKKTIKINAAGETADGAATEDEVILEIKDDN